MTIQGPGPRGVSRPTDHRVSGGTGAAAPDQSTPAEVSRTGRVAADVVEVTQNVPSAAVPTGTMSPEALREVTSWLAAGGHDGPEVHQAIADAIHSEVRGEPS